MIIANRLYQTASRGGVKTNQEMDRQLAELYQTASRGGVKTKMRLLEELRTDYLSVETLYLKHFY